MQENNLIFEKYIKHLHEDYDNTITNQLLELMQHNPNIEENVKIILQELESIKESLDYGRELLDDYINNMDEDPLSAVSRL